jgi:CHAT domain-containing protein
LENSVEVIVGFPSESREESFKHYTADVSKDDFEQQLDLLQNIISARPRPDATDNIVEWVSSARSAKPGDRATVTVVPDGESLELDENFIAPAAQLYDWLIRPITEDPEIGDTKVLAFVLDGALRNVPMSVLYDREKSKYLIEQYAIALTPGLELIDPQPLARGQIKALVAGLSAAVDGLPELPAVEVEVDAIEAQVPSEVLENEGFKIDIFQDKLTSLPFPVVHLATHGEFSSDLDKTFIQAFDGKINANQLSSMLQAGEISRDAALELLVLSACETASGDDQQAALGLAGIAVRSGARSTLATLWKVDDQGTSDLMTNFYQELTDNTLTKAEILQKAQIKLIENDQYQKHPYFWAPFVLIGNWL